MFFDKMSLININEFKLLETFYFCSSPNGRCIENSCVILLVRFSRVTWFEVCYEVLSKYAYCC